MKQRDTQRTRVIDHLNKFGSITPAEAVSMYGIYRLAAIINVLRSTNYFEKDGKYIKTTRTESINRYGVKSNYAVYSLEKSNK